MELLQLSLDIVHALTGLALLQFHGLPDLARNANGFFVNEYALGFVFVDQVGFFFLEVVESEDGGLTLLAGYIRRSP